VLYQQIQPLPNTFKTKVSYPQHNVRPLHESWTKEKIDKILLIKA